MRLFKKIKKIVNGTVRKVENFAHRATGQPNIGEKEPELDMGGTRSQAAKRLAETQKQAGAGQIKYNTEEEVT